MDETSASTHLNMMLRYLAAGLLAVVAYSTHAYQLAPLGSKFEARLTNEKNSNLSSIAGKVGVLLKSPVHEEITQLGFECAVESSTLANDTICASADAGFANPFVIYGVRWNDLPPFRLAADEGNCTYLGTQACRTDQTIRFSTQPLCWYCLFKDSGQKAKTKKITGCAAGKEYVRGNLMTRSHFGDLQFLHGMASEDGESPAKTQERILHWMEFAWKVATREIKGDAFLRHIEIPTIQAHFGCSEWRVSDIYILGRQDDKTGLIQQLHQIAFGSLLHTVQDSFAAAHTSRENATGVEMCEGTGYERPPRVVEFHTYAAQDGGLHDEHDSRDAMVAQSSADAWPQAVKATRNLAELFQRGAKWSDVKPYASCLFETVSDPHSASAGERFRQSSGN